MSTERQPYFRHIEVKLSDGNIISTSMAAHVTDQEIKDYYKIGMTLNTGIVNDNLVQITEVNILKSPQAKQVLMLMDLDFEYKEALDIVTCDWYKEAHHINEIAYLERELNKFI